MNHCDGGWEFRSWLDLGAAGKGRPPDDPERSRRREAPHISEHMRDLQYSKPFEALRPQTSMSEAHLGFSSALERRLPWRIRTLAGLLTS